MKHYLKFLVIVFLFTGVVKAQNSKVNTASAAIYSAEYEKAREAIEEAALNEKTKGQAKTWFYRGRIYNLIALDTTGKFSSVEDPAGKALESFRIALSLEDVKNFKSDIAGELLTTYGLFFAKGANAYNAGNNEDAYKYFSKAYEANQLQIEADPKTILDKGLIFNIGLMAERTNRTDEAIMNYQKLVDMKYEESYLYSRLANLYAANGREDEGIKVIEAGRTAFPQDKELMIAELNYYITNNNLNILVDKLDKAIELDPKNTELYFVLGVTYGQLYTIYADSLEALKKMKPSETIGADQLKILKAETDKKATEAFNNAVKTYETAINYEPGRFDVNLNLGALYYNQAAAISNVMKNLGIEEADEAEFQRLKTQRTALFIKGLPYFENAHQIDPSDLETMIALKEIYAKTENEKMMMAMKEKIEGDVRGVKIGMSYKDVTDKLGEPKSKTPLTNPLGTAELWDYNDLSLDFRNEKLYMITKK
ncbi:MAG: hypothetical protein ACHQFW_06050 [Chitinophagales bacterium]